MSSRSMPNPNEPVEAKRKFRFSGEPKKEINHESMKGPQYDSTYLRGRRKHEKKIIQISCFLNFVFSW